MPSFLGKTITASDSLRITNSHARRIDAADREAPTLLEVEGHYWGLVDTEIVQYDRAELARVVVDNPLGLRDK